MPPYTTIISRALTIALATTALAVPAAIAKPIDMRSPDTRDGAIQAPAVDLRSPDARDAADGTDTASGTSSLAATPSSSQDLRGPDAKEAPAPLPGPPTWPTHPQVIRATQAAPHDDSDGMPWAMFAVGLAGAAGVAAAGGGIVARSRRRSRVAA